MLNIGQINQLRVTDSLPFGFACNGNHEQVLIPNRDINCEINIGDELELFVYPDADGRLIGTSARPNVMVGECASLLVKDINKAGAWLDWGLKKQLLLPVREQSQSLCVGYQTVIYAYLGDDGLIYASNKLHKFLSEQNSDFSQRQPVNLLIAGRSPLGYKAVIDGTHLGLLHKDEVFKKIRIGQKYDGFIKRIRDDNKIDLCFQFHDEGSRDSLQETIIQDLKSHGGISTLTDKSSPEDINHHFNVSKKAYKNALGALYKNKRILIDKDKITLVE